jgi:hypothetical protein
MRRHDRAALRVQSLEPIAQKSAGRSRTGLLLAPSDADVFELHRRWPVEAACRVPGGH